MLSGQCSGHCMLQHVSRLSLLLVGWNTKKNNFLSKFVCLWNVVKMSGECSNCSKILEFVHFFFYNSRDFLKFFLVSKIPPQILELCSLKPRNCGLKNRRQKNLLINTRLVFCFFLSFCYCSDCCFAGSVFLQTVTYTNHFLNHHVVQSNVNLICGNT